jgi:NADPH:quinone reductase-like Zn-dependent oxidoreductase
MKAARLNTQTFRFEIQEAEVPQITDDEVLINIKAAAINHHELWTLKEKSISKDSSLIMGSDGAGIVAAVGKSVTGLQLGDKVISNPSLSWGDNPRVQGPDFEILGGLPSGHFCRVYCY